MAEYNQHSTRLREYLSRQLGVQYVPYLEQKPFLAPEHYGDNFRFKEYSIFAVLIMNKFTDENKQQLSLAQIHRKALHRTSDDDYNNHLIETKKISSALSCDWVNQRDARFDKVEKEMIHRINTLSFGLQLMATYAMCRWTFYKFFKPSELAGTINKDTIFKLCRVKRKEEKNLFAIFMLAGLTTQILKLRDFQMHVERKYFDHQHYRLETNMGHRLLFGGMDQKEQQNS